MRLDRNARGNERPRLAEAAHDRVRIESASGSLEKSKRRFQNIVRGSPAESGEIGRDGSVLRGVPCLERLGHRTEIVSEASAFRGANSDGVDRLHGVQTAQFGASNRAPKTSARAGGVETFVVVTRRNSLGDFGFDLNARVIRNGEFLAGLVTQLAKRKRGRQYADGGMRQQPVDSILRRSELSIIKIVSLYGHTVSERGKTRVSLHSRADNAGLHVPRPKRLHVFPRDRSHHRRRARER